MTRVLHLVRGPQPDRLPAAVVQPGDLVVYTTPHAAAPSAQVWTLDDHPSHAPDATSLTSDDLLQLILDQCDTVVVW